MTKRPLSLLILAGFAALSLAGCKTETAGGGIPAKALQPIAPKTVALMAEKGMRKEDPILVRIYKEDSQLEVWKKRQQDGRYALLKTYDICRWSGNLGPKKAEGDKQAPEGFYTVTPAQMNPRSAYYLSFDLGFPNSYDRSLGRTGKHLMVHGDCLSAGCYAMTDPQIAEVYALAREAFRGGQKSFQVQAMPFRMTAENMARRRNDPNLAFWKNLKQGSDHFVATRQEPKVAVCGRKYVFDAQSQAGSFDPNAACPPYEIEPSVAMAVAPKIKRDEEKFAQLVAGNVQTASAYEPQNGRIRRALSDPLPQRTLTASAEPEEMHAPAPSSSALAMADNEAPRSSGNGMLGWMRRDTPKELNTASTPVATASAATISAPASEPVVTAAAEPVQPAMGQPVAASLGGASGHSKPFYKKMLGLGSDEAKAAPPAAPVHVAVAAPVEVPAARPAPVAAPRPAPKPVARTAAPAPVAPPAPVAQASAAQTPAPAPAPKTAANAPELRPQTGLIAAPILSTGTFR
ncbi:L,D-transpeptidase family protein [Terrihabitans sp. B22-R8]|uniref:L,D-transpeptidase family protein n=1 Tax=Terrihabitans sp. B22-R8 TaxID=3425128 RepID=UPI00403CA792